MSWAALPCLPNGDRLKLSVPTTKMTLSAFGCGDRDGKLANSEKGLEKHKEAGKTERLGGGSCAWLWPSSDPDLGLSSSFPHLSLSRVLLPLNKQG